MYNYFKKLSVTRIVASLSLMFFHTSKTTKVLKINLYLINILVLKCGRTSTHISFKKLTVTRIKSLLDVLPLFKNNESPKN